MAFLIIFSIFSQGGSAILQHAYSQEQKKIPSSSDKINKKTPPKESKFEKIINYKFDNKKNIEKFSQKFPEELIISGKQIKLFQLINDKKIKSTELGIQPNYVDSDNNGTSLNIITVGP